MTNVDRVESFHYHRVGVEWPPAVARVRSAGRAAWRGVVWLAGVVVAVLLGVRGRARGVARSLLILGGLGVVPVGVAELAGWGWGLLAAGPVMLLGAWALDDDRTGEG